MKHLKQIGKMGIFFVACAVVFGFFGENIFAAEPDSDSSCRAKPFEGVCKEPGKECTPDAGYKKYGHCDTSDTPCCVPDENIPKSGSTPITTKNECDATKGSDGKNAYCITTVGQNCSTFSLDQIGTCGSGTACCASKGTPVPGGGTSSTPSSPSGSTAALNYTPLENLPGFENLESREIEGCGSNMFCKYFKALYLLALWIVGISALFMLVVGGFLYLSSAGNTHLLGTAKKAIYAALIGLIIALISWLLLDTINSDLTNLKLSGLSGAVGTSTNGGATSGNEGKTPPAGSVESCKSMKTQVSTNQCDDASANLLGALQCMNQELGGRMTLSSISDKNGFKGCQDSWTDSGCAHAQNSCHYGGKGKYPKSCAADISRSASGTASDAEFRAAAKKCNVAHFDIHGSPVAHVHISTSECDCDSTLPSP